MIFAVLLLSACAAAPTAVPTPTPAPVWIRLAFSSSLGSLAAEFAACVPEGAGLAVQTVDGWAFREEDADIRLIWGDLEQVDGYGAELGSEELVVVVHPQNPIAAFDLEDLRLVYSGELQDWDLLGQAAQPLQPYALPAGSAAWQLFEEAVLGEPFSLGREVVIAPSPELARAAVAGNSGSLGILPRRYLDETVRAVPISDVDQGALVRPILAISPAEPQDAPRAWLACLQERVK